jgi:hypothetical protein
MRPVSLWFRPKRFGIGYLPASWEGWVATTVLALVIVGIARLLH